nr:hypothetical protein [Nostoc sp. CmiVER01]
MYQQKAGADQEVFDICCSIKTPVRNQNETRNQSGYIADSNLQCGQIEYYPLKLRVLGDRSQTKIRHCKYVMQV